MRRAVVIGGAGVVGAWFSACLRTDGWGVVTVDRSDADVVADVRRDCELLATVLSEAELVSFALPEELVRITMTAVAPLVPRRTIMVAMSSVQLPVFSGQDGAFAGLSIVGCNPMFRPTLSSFGRVALVVAEPDADPLAIQAVAAVVEASGASFELVSPQQNDDLLKATQVIPHAAVLGAASAILDSGVDLSLLWRVAPPPARVMLAAIARILGAAPHVYTGIQHAEGATQARASLSRGVARLSSLSEEEMTAHLVDLRRGLESLLSEAEALAAQIYESVGSGKQVDP